MPLATQSKLLRVVQNQEMQRVGSPEVRKVDVRVVAATNRDVRASGLRKSISAKTCTIAFPWWRWICPRWPTEKRIYPCSNATSYERFVAQLRQDHHPVMSRRAQAISRSPWLARQCARVGKYLRATPACWPNAEFLDVRDLPDYLHSAMRRKLLPMTVPELMPLVGFGTAVIPVCMCWSA